MELDEAISIANRVSCYFRGKPLSLLEVVTLRGIFDGFTYQEIARRAKMDDSTHCWSWTAIRDAASRLGQLFAQALGMQSVHRTRFQTALIELRNLSYDQITQPRTLQELIERTAPLIPANQMSRRQMPRRPFSDRGCIRDPDRFYDRELLMQQIFNELNSGNNLSIFGDSQIGKSSILWQICNQITRRVHSKPNGCIFLDMQQIHTEAHFFEQLCSKLGLNPIPSREELADRIGGMHYILCIDEIERMSDLNSFSGCERIQLRGLADGADAPFTIVTASFQPLSKSFPDLYLPTSPLHNIFTPIHVKPFSPEIARRFIEHRLQGTGIEFDITKIEDWIQKTEGHPAKLQELADTEYRRLTGELEE